MTIVRQSAANNNHSCDAYEKIVNQIELTLTTSIAGDAAFAETERFLLNATNEAVRRCLQRRMQSLSDAIDDDIRVGPHTYRRHQPGRVKYFSLCGSFEIDRWTYRRVDVRNGPTIVAVDRVAGIVERVTPALAYAIAQGVAKAPVRHVEADLRAAFREPPSRSKMDGVARFLGEEVNCAVDQIEPHLRRAEALPSGAKAINMGLDRTTIPMEEAPDEAGLKRGAKVAVRYRMAYIATFCVTDKDANVLVTRRYAAPAHEGPDNILARLKADLLNALKREPTLEIGVVQDGAPEMWNLMRAMLDSVPQLARPRKMGKPQHWRETIDRYHLVEKLARALELLVPNGAARAALLAQWNSDLDDHVGAIVKNSRWLDDRKAKATRAVRNELHRIFGHYFACPDHFHYASLRRHGLQQGSGITEGACKSLVTMRAKRSGQRWRPAGISGVLAIRTLLDSDRFPNFWSHLSRRFVAAVKSAA